MVSITKKNFVNWANSWDERISTQDDRDTIELTREKFNWCIGTINRILSETDDKAMSKFKTDEERVKAMFKNQEKSFFTEILIKNIFVKNMIIKRGKKNQKTAFWWRTVF